MGNICLAGQAGALADKDKQTLHFSTKNTSQGSQPQAAATRGKTCSFMSQAVEISLLAQYPVGGHWETQILQLSSHLLYVFIFWLHCC